MTEPSVTATLKKVSGVLVVLGIAQIILGSMCILAPFAATEALATVIGILLLVAGIVEIIQAVQSRGFGAGGTGFLGGVLAVLGGILIILAPMFFIEIFAMLVSIYFFVDGVQRIMLAWRFKPADGWGWIMFGGVLGLLLGVMLISGWPYAGTWFLGVLVGIRVLFRGWAVLMLALVARRAQVD